MSAGCQDGCPVAAGVVWEGLAASGTFGDLAFAMERAAHLCSSLQCQVGLAALCHSSMLRSLHSRLWCISSMIFRAIHLCSKPCCYRSADVHCALICRPSRLRSWPCTSCCRPTGFITLQMSFTR